MKKPYPPPPLSSHTSLFSHEMTPLFNQLWIMKFCTRDPFSLQLTVIELHSHAIPFTTAMRRKERGGGAASLCSVWDEGDFPVTSWAPAKWHRYRGSLLCIDATWSDCTVGSYSWSIGEGGRCVCAFVFVPKTTSRSHKLFTEAP